ncbi:CCA tRNA nucleotidyltransferase [Paenibacillus chartarius]|uniref:CCA tRNA nucleotidyltransferase n=1 Tax=Paenibacillus chartarius TaxID=747481 RepID=A0ABV6DQA3_9BACL
MSNEYEMERGAHAVLRTLTGAGYEAVLVGGCVRDRWLGLPVKDMDIATSALPEQVMSLFAHTVPTGLQHGTVTVIPERGGPAFEVTTFRTEGDYADYRRPETVEFVTSLDADLQRRDFTMNAMAEYADGRLYDPYGGRDDLGRGVLRCVGEARERFGEDALRMLRCVRFAAAYGLEIEAGTWAALQEQAPLLRHVAMERCRAELERMVEGRAPVRSLQLLAESGLWRHFKVPTGVDWGRGSELAGGSAGSGAPNEQHRPDEPGKDVRPPVPAAAIRSAGHEADAGARGLEARWTKLEEPETKWALLWTLLGVDSDASLQAMQALVFAKRRMEAVGAVLACDATLAQQAAADAESVRAAWVRAALRYGVQALRRWLALRAAAAPPDGPQREALHSGAVWLAALPAATLQELAVGGADVQAALGERGGPWLGELLHKLLVRVALGELRNEREPLLTEARRLREQQRSS